MDRLLQGGPLGSVFGYAFHLIGTKWKQLVTYQLSVLVIWVLLLGIGGSYMYSTYTSLDGDINLADVVGEEILADGGEDIDIEFEELMDIYELPFESVLRTDLSEDKIMNFLWSNLWILVTLLIIGITIGSLPGMVYQQELLEYTDTARPTTTFQDKYTFALQNVLKYVGSNIIHFIVIFLCLLIVGIIGGVIFGVLSGYDTPGTSMLIATIGIIGYILLQIINVVFAYYLSPYLTTHGINTGERFMTPIVVAAQDMKGRFWYVLGYVVLFALCVLVAVLAMYLCMAIIGLISRGLFELHASLGVLAGTILGLIFFFGIGGVYINTLFGIYMRWRYTAIVEIDTPSKQPEAVNE